MENKKPKVNEKTLVNKIFEGVHANNWAIIGTGGTKKEMVKPLIEYLKKSGIEVK